MEGCVKVKRDGPRGWHWVAVKNFDPAKHELYEPAKPEQIEAVKRRGRPPKSNN